MGDVVLTTGAIPFFRERFPEARIDYLTRPPFAALLEDEPGLHRVISLPRRSGGPPFVSLMRYGAFLKDLRDRKYDLVIDFFARGPRSRVISLVTGAPRRMALIDRVGSLSRFVNPFAYTEQVVPPVQLARMADRIPYLLSRISRLDRHPLPHLTVTPENLRSATDLLDRKSLTGKKFWIFFCGSGIPQKNWPSGRFAEIARRLLRKGLGVYCLGGEMDRPEQEALARSLGPLLPSVHFGTQLPLGTVKALCHLAEGALGNDSGPLHLAQAVGCPAVVVFGPGDHVSYAPFLGRPVFGQLSCQPCQSFAGRCSDNQCIKGISAETVWEAIETLPPRVRPFCAPPAGEDA